MKRNRIEMNNFLVKFSSFQLCVFVFFLVEPNKTLAPAYMASFKTFIVTNTFI